MRILVRRGNLGQGDRRRYERMTTGHRPCAPPQSQRACDGRSAGRLETAATAQHREKRVVWCTSAFLRPARTAGT
eukprot:3321024-Pleurochrysis_carterae.AAC.1